MMPFEEAASACEVLWRLLARPVSPEADDDAAQNPSPIWSSLASV